MYIKKDEEKKSMDAIIEYVRDWCMESSKNGFERYMKEFDEKIAKEAAKEVSFDVAKRMLEDNAPISNIMKYTGLTKKQVLNLK